MKAKHYNFYKTYVNISNMKSMFNYIHSHVNYYTREDSTKYSSIANNVNLNKLNIYSTPPLGSLRTTNINLAVVEWERDHPDYAIELVNRHLVLKNKSNDGHVLPSWLVENNYSEFKTWVINFYGNKVSDYKQELRTYVKLIREFDLLCEEIKDIDMNVHDITLNN